MNIIRKCLLISGVGAIGAVGALFTAKIARRRQHAGMYEKAGKSIDEKLKESKESLDRATSRIQSVFDRIRNRKS
jgi:hypothetical protein